MQVAWRTPLAKLDALERCLNDWLAREENRWFMPSTSVTLQKIDFQRHLEITIGIGHNGCVSRARARGPFAACFCGDFACLCVTLLAC